MASQLNYNYDPPFEQEQKTNQILCNCISTVRVYDFHFNQPLHLMIQA